MKRVNIKRGSALKVNMNSLVSKWLWAERPVPGSWQELRVQTFGFHPASYQVCNCGSKIGVHECLKARPKKTGKLAGSGTKHQLCRKIKLSNTERHSWVVNTPASYSGAPGFKSRSSDRLSWRRCFVGFLSLSRQMPGWYLKFDHYRLLANHFQFITHPYHISIQQELYGNDFKARLYIVWVTEKAMLNKLQINEYKIVYRLSDYIIKTCRNIFLVF
jgi:hypothetical protein